jgi:hypothetical protein
MTGWRSRWTSTGWGSQTLPSLWSWHWQGEQSIRVAVPPGPEPAAVAAQAASKSIESNRLQSKLTQMRSGRVCCHPQSLYPPGPQGQQPISPRDPAAGPDAPGAAAAWVWSPAHQLCTGATGEEDATLSSHQAAVFCCQCCLAWGVPPASSLQGVALRVN